MARLFYVHWHKDEALETVRSLRAAGHTVVYHWDKESGHETWKRFKANPPEALVISLTRLPSHGRRVAMVTREAKKYQDTPIVFVDGETEKVAKAKQEFPGAKFTSTGRLLGVLERML